MAPVVAMVLVAGILGYMPWWAVVLLLAMVIAGLLATVYGVRYARRSVTVMWLEPRADVPMCTVLRRDGTRARFPVAAVTRIRVTRYRVQPPSLHMKLWVGSATEHTLTGLVEPARPFLIFFAQAGASIVTRFTTPDPNPD